MAKNTGQKITDILKDTKSKKKKRVGPSSRTDYTGPKLKPKLGGTRNRVRGPGSRSKSLSDTHREVVEERKRKQGENKTKRTGWSRHGRGGGGYIDLGPQSGFRKGRNKYRIRPELKV